MYVYVIGPNEGAQKIGFTKNLETRLRAIQTGHPSKLYIHHYVEVTDKQHLLLEKKVHRELNHKKLKGEWFDLTKTEAVELLTFFGMEYIA